MSYGINDSLKNTQVGVKSSFEIKRLWDKRVQEEDAFVSNSGTNVDKIFSIEEMKNL